MTDEESIRYVVVHNDEEQFSIWPADQDPPAGWYADPVAGTQEQCLAHIREVWTDMRPLRLRKAMEANS